MMMKKSKALVGASTVLVCALLASPLIKAAVAIGGPVTSEKSATSTPEPTPTKHYEKVAGTWTYDCEFPVQRPETIMLTCADGGMTVTGIKWKTWNANEAAGTGIYSQNMCDPSCAEGERVDVPVTVRLGNLFQHKGRNVLGTLDIEAASGRELPNGVKQISWDVSEFAVTMNWGVNP